MEFFSGLIQERSRQSVVSIIVSTAVHVLCIVLVFIVPVLRSRSMKTDQFVDVTLLDYAMPDLSADIVPSGVKAVEPEPVEDPKPVPKKELVDPSDAELKRMKNREENRTPPPVQPPGEEFSMQTGLLPGGGGQTLGSIRIDAKDFPFMYYLGMLKTRVSDNWIPPFGSFEADNKRVVIAFRIDRRGQLLTSQVEETSGDALLDQSALRAVIVSAPFPPLPDGYLDPSLGIHFGFICKL